MVMTHILSSGVAAPEHPGAGRHRTII